MIIVISEGRCLKISYTWIGQYTYIMLRSKGCSWKTFLSTCFTKNDMLSLIHKKFKSSWHKYMLPIKMKVISSWLPL